MVPPLLLRKSCSVFARRRSAGWLALGCLLLPILTACATSGAPSVGDPADQPAASSESSIGAPTILYTIFMYLPNRVFDLFDLIRLRARVGPGFAVSARATKPVSATIGSYFSVWAGLPGPRQAPLPPIPAGVEAFRGAQAGLAEVGATGGDAPNYSPAEVGAGVHLLLIGLDLGVDPWELLDFAAGILVLDPVGDDL
jgi:hypothetical protein